MTIYIQCTAKLLRKLDYNEYTAVVSPNNVSLWHANLLCVNRKEYVLFTHDTTLYSLCVSKSTKQFFNNLDNIIWDNLMRNLEHENLLSFRLQNTNLLSSASMSFCCLTKGVCN